MARYKVLARISIVLFIIAFLLYGIVIFPISLIWFISRIEPRMIRTIMQTQLISIIITYISIGLIISEVANLDTWRFLKALTVSVIFLSFYAILDILIINKQYSIYPPDISLYMFIIITLVISVALMKYNDKVLKILSVILQSIIITIFLTAVMVQVRFINTWTELIFIVLLITLLTIWFTAIERFFGIFHGYDKPMTCFIKIIKKTLLSISALILLSILSFFQYNNSYIVFKPVATGLGSEMNIMELLIVLISHLTILGIVIGFGAVIAYLFSPHGYKAIITAIKYFKGESLDSNNLLFYELIDKSELPVSKLIETTPAAPSPLQPTTEPQIITQTQQQYEQQKTITETKTPSYTTKRCNFCGKDIPADSQFCPYCGAYLTTDEGTTIYTSEESKEKEQRSS